MPLVPSSTDINEKLGSVYVKVPGFHLDRPYSYLPAPNGSALHVGDVVSLLFKNRKTTGFVVGTAQTPLSPLHNAQLPIAVEGEGASKKSRPISYLPISQILGRSFDPIDVEIWRTIANDYCNTFANVAAAAVPEPVQLVRNEARSWSKPTAGKDLANLIATFTQQDHVVDISPILDAITEQRYEHFVVQSPIHNATTVEHPIVQAVLRACALGKQVLILCQDYSHPVVTQLQSCANQHVTVLSGAANPKHDYREFLRWRLGHTRIVIGPSRCVLWPGGVPHQLGLAVALSEANPAYKQRQGAKFGATQALAIRAAMLNIPFISHDLVPSAWAEHRLRLGTATRVASTVPTNMQYGPRIELVVHQHLPVPERRGRIKDPVIRAMRTCLQAGQSVIILAAMKGAGRTIVCSKCQDIVRCTNCGGAMHPEGRNLQEGQWHCHACSQRIDPAPCINKCDRPFSLLGAGVKTLANELAKTFPEFPIVTMEGYNDPGPTSSEPTIAIMTRGSVMEVPTWIAKRTPKGQMPRVPLVVCADPDVMLGGEQADANENTMRLLMQISQLADHVMVQTVLNEHHVMKALVRQSATWFWEREYQFRIDTMGPPVYRRILARRVADDQGAQLQDILATSSLKSGQPLLVLGPDEKQNLIIMYPFAQHKTVLDLIKPMLQQWAKQGKAIRLEIDPLALPLR